MSTVAVPLLRFILTKALMKNRWVHGAWEWGTVHMLPSMACHRIVCTNEDVKAGAAVGFSTSLTYMLEAIAPQLVGYNLGALTQ